MRIALVNLACPNDLARADVFSYMPPLGVMYLAGWLEMCRIPELDLVVFDVKEEESPYLPMPEYDVVGIGLWQATMDVALELAKSMKQLHPETYIVGGGPMTLGMSAVPQDFDCVVKGVGYGALERIARGDRPKGILKESRHEVDFTLPDRAYGYQAGALLTSFGCPFKCHFCEAHKLKAFDFRSADNVVEEIKRYIESPTIRYFEFFDNIAFMHPSMGRFIDTIGGRKKWGAILDCRRKRGELKMVERAVDNGLVTLGLGIESTDREVLGHIDKRHTQQDVERTLQALRPLKKKGLRIHAFMMYGLPHQTMQSVVADMKYIRGRNIAAQFTRLRVMPGTWLYTHRERCGLEIKDDYTVKRTKWMSERELDLIEAKIKSLSQETVHDVWEGLM
jgi:radical SAM superfamily enzyme YgiQ (UPF0313 family)